MDLRQLAALVARMRKAQKAYFRDRKSSDLDTSKQLEREVDDAVRKILSGETQRTFIE